MSSLSFVATNVGHVRAASLPEAGRRQSLGWTKADLEVRERSVESICIDLVNRLDQLTGL